MTLNDQETIDVDVIPLIFIEPKRPLSKDKINFLKRRGYIVHRDTNLHQSRKQASKQESLKRLAKELESSRTVSGTRKILKTIRYKHAVGTIKYLKPYYLIKRVKMIKSNHWVESPIPQIDAYNKMSIMYRYLANDFTNGQIHESEQLVIDSLQNMSSEEIESEIVKLEKMALDYK